MHASRLHEVPLAQYYLEGPPQVASPPRAGLLPVKFLETAARGVSIYLTMLSCFRRSSSAFSASAVLLAS